MGGRERERDFVPYFTASFCWNSLNMYYLAYAAKNEFKILILLRRLDGQQFTIRSTLQI